MKSGDLIHSLLARFTTLLDLFGDVLVKKRIWLLQLTSDLRDLILFSLSNEGNIKVPEVKHEDIALCKESK